MDETHLSSAGVQEVGQSGRRYRSVDDQHGQRAGAGPDVYPDGGSGLRAEGHGEGPAGPVPASRAGSSTCPVRGQRLLHERRRNLYGSRSLPRVTTHVGQAGHLALYAQTGGGCDL